MAKPKRLATTVYVAGRAWGPADDVPDEVAEQITNPKAWAAAEEPEPAEAKAKKAGTRSGVRLAATVHVAGRAYGPDDQVPDHVAKQIRNPRAWEGGKLPAGVATGGVVHGPGSRASDTVPTQVARDFVLTPEQVAELDADPGDGDQEKPAAAQQDRAPARIPAPPRTGAGSGADAWAAFAATQGVEVEDGASRNDIIAACQRAGVLHEK